ncbi:MAG: T9SS type A sorting domain-containing protein [Saprospiraceae bacterium]
MKKIFPISALVVLMTLVCNAQKEDNTWILSKGADVDYYKITSMTFQDSVAFAVHPNATHIDFAHSNSSISDRDGNLLFFSNGPHVYSRNYKYMDGGIYVNRDTVFNLTNEDVQDNTIILPFPGRKDLYAFFYLTVTLVLPKAYVCSRNLSMAVVDMQKKNGLGAVLPGKKLVISDTIEVNKLTATKHANGRDWWIIIQDYFSNKYYKVLLDPNGADIHDIQRIGIDSVNSIGKALFSPDGKYYINFDIETDSLIPNLAVFNFDRCSGELSNPRYVSFGVNDAWTGGAAVSPNSRYLYISRDYKIFQYDLWADDLTGSQKIIGEFDGYIFNNQYTKFYQAQLAPNGKIYISSPAVCPFLHVINNPDLRGDSCNFVQRGQKLPKYNAWSVPNHPNYRLGALKGSPCDTLHSIAVKERANILLSTLFPNPTSDQVTIKWQNDESVRCEITIIDAVGRIIQRQESHASSLIVDTSSWANGLYYVQIVEEKGRKKAFLKIVKGN